MPARGCDPTAKRFAQGVESFPSSGRVEFTIAACGVGDPTKPPKPGGGSRMRAFSRCESSANPFLLRDRTGSRWFRRNILIESYLRRYSRLPKTALWAPETQPSALPRESLREPRRTPLNIRGFAKPARHRGRLPHERYAVRDDTLGTHCFIDASRTPDDE